MKEQKTKPTEQSVNEFLNGVSPDSVREDCRTLINIMQKVTGKVPQMWGNIVGFGRYHYKYDSGHEGYSCLTGFSPRKQNISLYVMPGYADKNALLDKLGKHKAGKGCLYIKQLKDVDIEVLEQIIKESVSTLKSKYPTE